MILLVQSFNLIKEELVKYPVLRFYNPKAYTELHTNARVHGLRAIVLQKQNNNVLTPIVYFNQTINKTEMNYHSFELEMLAIVRAIKRFHIYLYGLEFTIIMDCNALVHAVNKVNLNPRIAR